ncbi:HAD family hydrolase [Mucilaginibacter sp. AK015]|uniref:HAD family hydrolase n=1 Tax=Mucilaginibacter sp. AK015 TaxID=2723072 RepID=UPI00161C47D0|nr:HAD family hydrolase [Mucilaginibacter sp. AK015]MBB5395311.1 putative hydrolase of the HAD superfamily [Mucilaginibacter sp. AK015]
MKRALFLDLDNTIYPVRSIAHQLFDKLFKLIDEDLGRDNKAAADKAKDELTRRPYQHVADEFGFSAALKEQGMEILRNCTFEEPMYPFEHYNDLRTIPIDKFLVTTGFTKLQMSKVHRLNIAADFKNIYVVDPELSNQTKKDVFRKIMEEYGYAEQEILVIGDDPNSEIKAAIELGIDTFLFDPEDKHTNEGVTHRAKDYADVAEIVLK